MKRVILSVTGTVLGLAALLSFKSHGHAAGAAGALPSAALPGASTSSPTARGTSSPAASPSPGRTTKPGASSSAATHVTTTSTFAGRDEQTQYGDVQVQIVVAGSRITTVSFLRLSADDGRSQQINSQAAPILLQETLAAQSANIDTVSGASYTSAGYIQSLQSALDQAGIK